VFTANHLTWTQAMPAAGDPARALDAGLSQRARKAGRVASSGGKMGSAWPAYLMIRWGGVGTRGGRTRGKKTSSA